jgi:hypothetical protein
MNRRSLLLGTATLLAPWSSFAGDRRAVATLYKDPDCGCCSGYADHLRRSGFEVSVVETRDLAPIKRRYGVPADLEGCHTTVVGGYAVEGHVPISAVRRLLAERPPVKGISLPGMPSGSPGMGGEKQGPFTVLAFGGTGGPHEVYALE